MVEHRLGDDSPPLERKSRRVYMEGASWFFSTREGKPMGPFDSEQEAREGLQNFKEFVELAPLETLLSLTEALTPKDDEPS